jgi:hypothetical protein
MTGILKDCYCVCNRFIERMNDKIRLCTLEHSSQEHIRQYVFLRSWERSEQVQKQRRIYFECLCSCVFILRGWHHYMG